MFERILLAVDGSTHADRATEVAAEFARRCEAEVTVLHVEEHPVSWAYDFDLAISEAGSGLVDDTVRRLKDLGVAALGEIRSASSGLVAQEIAVEAQASRATLIVMGTRGLSDWKGLFLGSVAHKVAQLAPCPVLVVR